MKIIKTFILILKMEVQRKCSVEEHKEINAIKYCPECRIYLCNKCENHHIALFKNHNPYNINEENEIFTGFCQIKNHNHCKLEYFCKKHNQLCCVACIAKLNEKDEGQHKDCDVCYIEKIKEEKKNKLKENIKILEELENKFNESITTLKQIFENIEKNKENLKLEIQNIFTKIRNSLNDREDELLNEIDILFNTKYFNEDIIKKGEKLPKQIKLSIEKGKLIDKEWNNKSLYSYINDCIKIENNIKNINIIKENINRYNTSNKIKIRFSTRDNEFDKIIETIKSFGKIDDNKYLFKECPLNIKENRKYIVSGDKMNILTCKSNNNDMGTICENELDKSIEEHKWKIKILKSNNVMVGVAPIDFDINSSSYETCGWYFYCYNLTLYSGPPYNYKGLKTNLSKVNDEIVVVMNMKKRTLKFIINNEDKGDSYINIPIDKPLFPAVFLHDQDDSIEII